MDEIRRELILKISELNDFVEKHAKDLLESAIIAQTAAEGAKKNSLAVEKSVTEKLGVLTLLPDWLEKLKRSLNEFTEVAKSLKPAVDEPRREYPSELFPDRVAHQQRLSDYQKQQNEIQRKRAAVALLESRFAVKDLVDSAVAIGCADKTDSGREAQVECCFLFSRGLPVEAIAERLEDLMDERWAKAMSAQKLKIEAERQLALNEVQVNEYVNARGGSNTLGIVVHRLLATKYPRPPVPDGQSLPRLKVMALLLGIDDQEVLSNIAKLMAESKVKMVQVQDALETCVEAYRREGPGLPLLESKEPPPQQEPEQVTATARLVPHALLEQLRAMEPPPKLKDVETQTGSGVVPQLSAAASLGKRALEVLRLQENLSDWLITAIVIEHLKQEVAGGILGWTLVNFPSNFEQVRLFEASISGQWVPNPDSPDEVQGGQFTLVQSRLVVDPADPVEAVMPFCSVFTSVVAVLETDPLGCVSLLHEVYMRQNLLACFHCNQFDEEKTLSVAELLFRPSPNPAVPLPPPAQEMSFPDFEIAADLKLGMASLWEAVETAYIGRLHRVTLTHRTMSNLTCRYLKTTKSTFRHFLGREDNLQRSVNDFVERYNEVPRPWDQETVEEMKNRVERLTQTLLGQTEARRREAELEIKEVAERPWLGNQLAEKLQLVGAVAQLELDRFVDTAALLQDYCFASLGKVPPDATKSLRFEVPKVYGEEISNEWVIPMAEVLLSNQAPEDILPEEFKTYLLSVIEGAKAYVDKLSAGIRTEIGKTTNEFKPKPAKGKGKAPKGKKGKGPAVENVPSLEDLELQRLTAKRMQLLQEWRDIVDNEAELTLQAVEREAMKQTLEAEHLIKKLWSSGFQVMRTAADGQQCSDSQSTQELREFLELAVEAASVLQPPILISRKTDYLRYLDRSNPPLPSTRPKNLCQSLRDLLEVLRRLAPDGRILLGGLAYLLFQSAASGKHIPPRWGQLGKEQIENVLRRHLNARNSAGVVDWRALIVGMLELPVASQQQLVMAAERLQRGSRETFCKARIWIDSVFDSEEDAANIKELLFEVYKMQDQTSADVLAFLSASVQDSDPLAALMKGCALHQGSVLEEEPNELGGAPLAELVMLESAVNACQAMVPTEDDSVATRLQQVWNEAEEMGLSDEQRRARNRATAAGEFIATDSPLASVQLLKENVSFVQLAKEYFSKQRLSDLVEEELLLAQ